VLQARLPLPPGQPTPSSGTRTDTSCTLLVPFFSRGSGPLSAGLSGSPQNQRGTARPHTGRSQSHTAHERFFLFRRRLQTRLFLSESAVAATAICGPPLSSRLASTLIADGQSLPSLCTATFQDLPAPRRCHPRPEPVRPPSPNPTRLVRPFHSQTSVPHFSFSVFALQTSKVPNPSQKNKPNFCTHKQIL